jgi:hypothetical protein
MYLTETIWRFCTADVYEIPVLYKHYLSNKSKYEWILTHWDDTLDDEIVTSQSFRALLYYLNDHGQCPSSIDGLKSSTQSNSHPEFAKASSFYSAEFAELKKYESEYLEMPLTVLFDNLFRKADTAWREHGLKEERRILRGNPLLKTEVYTYFPTIARKDVDKFLLSGPAVAELFHREYLAQAWGEEEDDLLKFDTSQLNLMGSVMDEEGDTHNIYVRSFADRTPKEMTWLWPGRVPSGTIVILSGNKSVGKTVCLLDWAARVTCVVLRDVPVHIDPRIGIVSHVGIEVQGLRITERGIGHICRLGGPVRRHPSSQIGRQVSCPEVIESGFGIAFFAGETIPRKTHSGCEKS